MTTKAYPIPDAVFEQHSAWLATSGAGKTTAVKGGVERMLARGERVVIIDPTGVWWGLRFLKDGRRASPYELVIFGRHHADLPIEAGSGEVIGRALGGSSASAILNLKGMSVADRTRFITDFFETLIDTNVGTLNVIIDEVHLFAPQSGGYGLTPMMLHATNNLVSLGRASGLRIAMISQRPAKVHKDSLTQAKALIALQCSHPLDQKPVKDWLSTTTSDKAYASKIMQSLAALPTGCGWFSAPQLGKLEPVHFPMIETFDSSKPGVEQIPLKPLDVAALRKAMSISSPSNEEAKRDTREVRPGPGSSEINDARALAAAEQRGYERGLADGEARGLERGAVAGWKAAASIFKTELASYAATVEMSPSEHESGEAEVAKALGLKAWPKASTGSATASATNSPAKNEEINDLKCIYNSPKATQPSAGAVSKPNGHASPATGKLGAERRILAVLSSTHPAAMSEAQWAVAAGMKRSGGTWGTYKSRLRTRGAIEQDGALWSATQVGLELLGTNVEPMPLPGPELVEFWIARIAGVGPMLRALAAHYPQGMDRETLAAAIGMAASGGSFGTYLSRLSSAGLIEKSGGEIRAARALMEPP